MKKQYEREMSPEELAGRPDSEIDTSDISELGDSFFRNARLIRPGEPEGSSLVPLDRDVVNWFRVQGKDHEGRMNAVLRAYMEAHRG